MAKWRKAAHVVYQCSYHLVWMPRAIRNDDKAQTVVIILPKQAISELMGIMKWETAIAILQRQKSL